MGRYFGTDGFRGEAGYVLTADHAYKIGRYLGAKSCRILIARDTRHSGQMFESALSAGITASGADAYLMHAAPTPAVSYVTKKCGFDCGIMVSASHNPYYDNGIKIINCDGAKPGEGLIEDLEDYLDSKPAGIPFALREHIGTVKDYGEGLELYRSHLISAVKRSFPGQDPGSILKGKRIALDCANGSASGLAASVFEELGALVFAMGVSPDGFNINQGVGSTHIEALQSFVISHQCDIGFAYDGDADRCLAADEYGDAVNGDQLMFSLALYLKGLGRLKDDTLVATIMSNLGLLKALEREGINYKTVKVGDRFVWECMAEGGYSLGGEQSGHIIFADLASTGDGILTSLMTMLALGERKASSIAASCPMYPQTLINIRVADKEAAMHAAELENAVSKAKSLLGGSGRILVRPSGTEPLIRVMAEAPDKNICDEVCGRVAGILTALEKQHEHSI